MYYVGVLFQRYTRMVSALAYNYLKDALDTEDAVMEVFETITKDLKQHEVKNFNAWLYSVTKNHCLKLKRQRAKARQVNDNLLASDASVLGLNAETEREMALLKNQRLDVLEEALQGLSNEQQQCIELFYLKEKSYKEVSELTGFSLKQVKSFLQNGKRNLQVQLLNKND